MIDESMAKLSRSCGVEQREIHNAERYLNPSEVLERIVNLATAVVSCDSCFVYTLEENELVLRASNNPQNQAVNRIKLCLGEGITGWVAEHLEPVALAHDAFNDVRFRFFNELPEDRYEAFLSVPILCDGGGVVGVINLQHREPHYYSQRQIELISTLGVLVGAAIRIAQLEDKNKHLRQQLDDRKVMERAKGIIQRDFRVTEEEAYITLQQRSRRLRKPLRVIAEAVINDSKAKFQKNESAS